MINPNELRCDNIVLYNNQYNYVSLIDCERGEIGIYPCSIPNGLVVSLKMIPSDNLSPAPITDKILSDWCGLEVVEVKEHNYKMHRITQRVFINHRFDVNVNSSDIVLYLCKIQYLHQLQNLYFVLTGQELKIKIPAE